MKSNLEAKNLTKTNVEAINVQPIHHNLGPCTCSVDGTLPDTIRNMFEQVDFSQRKSAENTYIRYIANKLLDDTIEVSFLFT